MHTNHLGFDSKPFNLKDPRGFYRNADFDAACAALLRGIRTRQGLLLLTSEAGLGKSLILRRCIGGCAGRRFARVEHFEQVHTGAFYMVARQGDRLIDKPAAA